MLALDYGDAPDTAPSTGPGNFQTLASDNGPRHTIVAGLRIGANVDEDTGLLQNAAANADDVNGALPDDEDGVINPASDLVLTVGAQPTVSVRVTNTTGTAATLYGWIDYNANGVFDNAAERASIAVPNGANNATVTLVFPAVPSGFTGTTYARFRLSTDANSSDPTGEVADGEVEDYRVTITLPSSGIAESTKNKKIASSTSGGPTLADGDKFGSAVAAIGDLDGDGIPDVAVGAPVENGKPGSGAVHILFMNANGAVKASQRIASGIGGGPTLATGDYFGHSVASLGDLDGDGVTDLAVGASKDDTGGYINGAVYILLMNTNGTVKSTQKIASGIGGGPALATGDRFGSSVAGLGDLDGDGIGDLAVGAVSDDTGGNYRGAVHVLFMNANGTVKSSQKIASGTGGGPALADLDFFGGAAANLGDLDGDGLAELAVGASGDDTAGNGRGAVHVLFLNPNGTAKSSQKIASAVGGGPALADGDAFGRSAASLGDLDGDGVTDLAVGAYRDATGGTGRGALHVLFMNPNGTAKSSRKIASGVGGGPALSNDDRFGSGVAAIGDLDGDGRIELAVGAETDDTGGDSRGAVHILFLGAGNTAPVFTSPAQVNVPENSTNVQTVTAIDSDVPPQTITYALAGGPDQARFSITSGGALSFVTPPNFESPADANGDNVYVVIVQASDGSLATFQAIVVTVTPVNDNSPVFTSPSAASIVENNTAVMTVTATDADIPAQTLTLSIADGADQSKFSLTSGALAFLAPPDFDAPTDANGDNIYEVVVQADDGNGRVTLQTILVTVLRPPVDNGDAPDGAAGTGRGNYNTREADNGPAHLIVPGLRIGASVDGDSGALQNADADADDVNAALPDDEDGLVNPAADLALTIGAQPTVNVRVTNTTGAPATLYGWIDYNANGVFDNATERASIAVPSGTNNGLVTLVFPTAPATYFGTTYSRFRLSTSAAAADPTGFAPDGEVEDYRATIIKPSESTAASTKTHKIAFDSNDAINIQNNDQFAVSVASIGDVDGDGVPDLAAGSILGTATGNYGAVFVMFMNPNGTVRASQQVGDAPPFTTGQFGRAVAGLGDLDGDGVPDLAVGTSGDVRILFLNTNGTVKRSTTIGNGFAGASIAAIGDLDGDGVGDMAVGDTGTGGAVYIVFMNSNGTAKGSQKIANGMGSGQYFGQGFAVALASLGDIDGDGATDIAVGAWSADSRVLNGGEVYVLRLNANGTVKSRQTIGSGSGFTLREADTFGASLASLGDIDGDGVTDLAVGATGDDGGLPSRDENRGAVYMLLLNSEGGVKSSRKIGHNTGGGPGLVQRELFGRTLASPGDLDGDGLTDLIVGSYGNIRVGALYAMFLNEVNIPPAFTSPGTVMVPENSSAVMTVTAVDVNTPPQTVTFSIASGLDGSKFNITSGGQLSFNLFPNFELPADSNGDNVYQVDIRATDSLGGSTTRPFNVIVTPVNDNPPMFTSADAVNVAENNTSVLTVVATDADLPPQTLSYSIVGGEDQSKFSITSGGALSFNSPPNFEAPTDSNGDNIYIVVVQASDGTFTDLQAILVTVTNVSEVPLVGDYNNNGAVDLADYVLWRNNGPLQNEGDTPGVVNQADYDIWRANFGRTTPAVASTSAIAAALIESVNDQQIAELRVETHSSQPVEIVESTVFALGTPLRNQTPRIIRTRPHGRDTFLPVTAHDDALVALLASRDTRLHRESAADVEHNSLGPPSDRLPPSSLPVDSLDMAFAKLSVAL